MQLPIVPVLSKVIVRLKGNNKCENILLIYKGTEIIKIVTKENGDASEVLVEH